MNKNTNSKKTRKNISQNTSADVIFKSHNSCCVCQNGKKGDHIHHIDGDPSNNDFNNLAYLCFDHHNQATITNSLSKKLSPRAITQFRDDWYRQVEEKKEKYIEGLNSNLNHLTEEDLLTASLNAQILLEPSTVTTVPPAVSH